MSRRSSSTRACLAAAFAAASMLAPAAMARAQSPLPAPAPGGPPGMPGVDTASAAWWQRYGLTNRFSGDVVITGELYGANGVAARRPGAAWRLSSSPQLALFGGMTVGVSLMLSDEEQSFRQNVSQFGINPTWRWLTLHAGDFTRGYSPYTTDGLRVRGGGIDVNPGPVHFGVQYGSTQRAVSSLTDGPVFRRNMLAGTFGVGSEFGAGIDFTVMHAKDDVNSVEHSLLVRDSLLDDPTIADTLPEALRPRLNTGNRPQQNVVIGTAVRLPLFSNRISFRGEIAGSVLTSDLTAPTARSDSLDGLARTLGGLMPLHLSTAGDVAYNGQLALNLRRLSLKGGYEYVGAGYNSLGLGYLINDRKAYDLGGSLRAFGDRLSFQGRFQHQNDNLLGQKTTTTSRNMGMASVSARVSNAVTTSVTGLLNVIGNDAVVDTFLVDMKSAALTANASLAHPLFAMPSTFSLAYGIQRTEDGNAVRGAPTVTVHTVSTSVQTQVTPKLTLAPTISGVVTDIVEQATQYNVFVGFRGQGRLLRDRLRPSASVSQSFANGRRVFSANTQTAYELPWGSRISLGTRFSSYSAFADRPGFTESFVTTSIARSF